MIVSNHTAQLIADVLSDAHRVNWRVYVKRDYMLRDGGDVNKFPGETFRPVLMQIDMIIHSERGLLMFASGPYRSYQTEYQAEALKRERGY